VGALTVPIFLDHAPLKRIFGGQIDRYLLN
jgi:hypothetical protein